MKEIISLLFVFYYCVSFGQTHFIDLMQKSERSYLTNTVYSVFENKNITKYKIVDTSKFEDWRIAEIPFDISQYNLERSGINLTNDKEFQEYNNKRISKDTTYLLRNNIPKNQVNIFVGIINDNERKVIIDENNNDDFTDDPVNIITRGLNESSILKNWVFDVYDGIEVKKIEVFLKINPFSVFLINGKAPILDVYHTNFLETLFEDDNRKFLIQINDQYAFERPSYNSATLMAHELPVDSNGRYYRYSYKLTDTIPLGNKLYVFGLKGNSLQLRQVGNIVENSIPAFDEKDLITGDIINNQSLKGRYTLIDFWGTWCGPCIQSLPHLVDLYKKYGDQVNFLSIADDKPADVEKLKTLIDTHRLEWSHIWNDRSKGYKQGLPNKFLIRVYPTIVLLDKETNEIKRFTGTNLGKLEAKLKDIFGE